MNQGSRIRASLGCVSDPPASPGISLSLSNFWRPSKLFNWSLLQAEQWVENLFGGDEELFERFLERHSMSQAWTDGYGIICQVSKRRKFHLNLLSQATALVVGREIQVIGTNHKEQGGEVAKVFKALKAKLWFIKCSLSRASQSDIWADKGSHHLPIL